MTSVLHRRTVSVFQGHDVPPKRARIYHALNRANARLAIFDSDDDYAAFERVLHQAVARFGTRLLAYCPLPGGYHLLLWPREDGDLSTSMRWPTMTHTQRAGLPVTERPAPDICIGASTSRTRCSRGRAFSHSVRLGRTDALRANLVEHRGQWKWGSPSARRAKDRAKRPTLMPWPIERPHDWTARVNRPFGPKKHGGDASQHAARSTVRIGAVAGRGSGQARSQGRLLRPRGRPRKQPNNGSRPVFCPISRQFPIDSSHFHRVRSASFVFPLFP